MTRWAFVSDIHGNRRALDSAELLAHEHGADRFVCLGDVIGRGDPVGCVEWVRDHADLAIVGNRDLDYLARVSPDLQAVVQSWAHELRASDFVASHGEPKLHRVLNSAAERDGFQRARAYLTGMAPDRRRYAPHRSARSHARRGLGPHRQRGDDGAAPAGPRPGQLRRL
jgi:hypothetical protein